MSLVLLYYSGIGPEEASSRIQEGFVIEFVYKTFAALGYTHPLHPASTHIPMGMLLGGFLFKLASYKWEELSSTANYCLILALIFAPISAVLGLMDWEHRLFGKMNNLILAKLIMTGCLLAVLSVTLYKNQKNTLSPRGMMLAYFLCFLLASGLGLVGGELAYG